MKNSMDGFIAIAKALSDNHRVRALLSLRKGELCACQIIQLLGLAPSTVSKHMAVLKQAGLVENRKDERWMFYRLPEEGKDRSALIQSTLKWIFGSLENDEKTDKDRIDLAKIIKQNPSSLCKIQRNR
jgi:ArsR family transcriptional regulator, arsenate/arsenite/antimonite-responsive transcriptional repressor